MANRYTSVPLVNQLSGGFLSSGVSFSSLANYVAVVNHGAPTVSMPNIIGGVKADGVLSFDCPINISFFDPSNHTILGVTDFVSIRGDQVPNPGAIATLEAFDIHGNSLGKVSAPDSSTGLMLSFSAPGIHSVTLTQSLPGTIGFDDLSFNAVSAVPVHCSDEIITFTAGTPAKAAEVNANFDVVRCQIQTLQALKAIVCADHPTASVCQ